MLTQKHILLLLTAVLLPLASIRAADLFVAPDGRDDNPGTIAQPLKTFEAARDAARKLPGPKTVFVRGGTYELEHTLTLEAKDSGVTWRAYENEKPIVVGGHLITNFTPYKGKILKAKGIKGVYFRQLFFDGQRQHLARYPNYDENNPYCGGWAYVDGKPVPMYKEIPGENKHTLQFKPGDAHPWAHPEEGEVFIYPRYNWWNNIVRIKSIDTTSNLITLAGDCSYVIRPFDRYYVQNLFEELDAPGEWYLDKRDWTLYFWPPAPLAGKSVCVPTLRTILEMGPGTKDVLFRGFTFECCEGNAISLSNTTNCIIAASRIRNVGDYHGSGVSIAGGFTNGVVGCDIYDIGSHGVAINGGNRITLTPAENYADNNYIHHIGVLYKQGVGVNLLGCGNRASHNYIHDGPRFGIQFAGNNLVIEYNHIRHMDLETDDTGAIYTGGRDWIGSRGSVVRYNYIHDMTSYGHDEKSVRKTPDFAWGIYLDDNTGGVDVIGNIVARCSRASIHLHNGRDNFVDNNIFIESGLQQMEYSGWTDKSRMWLEHLPTMIKGYESVASQPAWQSMRNMKLHPTNAVLPDGTIMAGNVLTHNIVAYENPKAKYFGQRNVAFDHNLIDSNLVWHHGLPLLTGINKARASAGPNLVANPGFEDTDAKGGPKDWHWQIRPNDSKATVDTTVKFSGSRSLRIDGRGTTTDAKGNQLFPNFVSSEIKPKPGQSYRLTARIKAAEPDTKFSLMAQSYVANAYYWSKENATNAGADWKEYEVVFKFPAPGDPNYKEQMKSFIIRLDVRQPSGTIWVDDVTLREAVGMDEWTSWQATGNDIHSVVANPLFVNAAQEDYRLKADSPAFKLGFKPIPIEKIGPYQDALRATWPITEAEGVREKPSLPVLR